MATEAVRATGEVQWFSRRKGIGFIKPDEGETDLFVHQSAILADGFRALPPGGKVSFVVGSSPDGRPCATEVVREGGGEEEAPREQRPRTKRAPREGGAPKQAREPREPREPRAPRPPQPKNEGPPAEVGTSGKGLVQWFSGRKGIGFISTEGGADLFCHRSALEEDFDVASLQPGVEVTYDVGESPKDKRPCATNVVLTGVVVAVEEPAAITTEQIVEATTSAGGEEKRMDGDDGPFTLQEFKDYYPDDFQAKWDSGAK